jgi:hypothetical protein
MFALNGFHKKQSGLNKSKYKLTGCGKWKPSGEREEDYKQKL